MRRISFLLLVTLTIFIISCEKDDSFDSGANTNTETGDTIDNTSNNIPDKYIIWLQTGDTIPLFTSSVNYADTIRYISQANFKNETYNIAIAFTYKAEPTESFDYTTESDRFFAYNQGVDNYINLYLTDFDANINYIVESGKTFTYSVSDTEYGYEFDNLTFTNETNDQESVTVTAKVVFKN